MNKTQIILAAIGGTSVLAALVLGFFVYSAYDTKATYLEDIESTQADISKLVKAPIKPISKSVEELKEKAEAYTKWTENANRLASRGDKKFDNESTASFQASMREQSHALRKITKDDFAFGFKQYVIDGQQPTEAQLPTLQRQWFDVTMVVNTLIDAGVTELTALDVKGAGAAVQAPEENQPKKGKKKPAKKNQKTAKVEEESAPDADVTEITLSFTTKPDGLVATLNAFASAERLTVVENLHFNREHDDVSDALGEKKEEAQSTGRRGRRRSAEPAPEETSAAEDDGKGKLVINPATASPLKVTMTVKVYDFKTAGKQVESPATEKEAE